MNKFTNWFRGKKTYIIAFLMVIVGVINYLSGDITLAVLLASEDLILVLQGIGLGTLRHGIN